MLLKVVDIAGKHCSQRDTTSQKVDGDKIRSLIESSWEKEPEIDISFLNVETATPSFLDEAIGKLALKYSLDELRSKLHFREMKEDVVARINSSIMLRTGQRQQSVSPV